MGREAPDPSVWFVEILNNPLQYGSRGRDGTPPRSEARLRIVSAGHAIFATVLVALGVLGVSRGYLTPIWQPAPASLPTREALAYVCGGICLFSGLGLLWQRTALYAARVLLASLLLWLLVVRTRGLILAPTAQDSWSGWGETAVLVAGAWVLYAWLGSDRETARLRSATGETGLRIARTFYALAMFPFGAAHFTYLKETATLVPHWLPWPIGWACFFGFTFFAAGVAVLAGVFARPAAALSTLQMGMFTLLVWIPIVAAGSKNAFVWSETIISVALTAGAWVVTDSYRGVPWFAVNRR